MGGCTNCKGKVGCDFRKGAMLESVDRTLERLYPTRTWGEPDDSHEGFMSWGELHGLTEELAYELNAATFLREGVDDEPCDYIYILCMGRTPCVLQVRDHGVPVPAEWRDVDAASMERGEFTSTRGIEELYLRVVISQRAGIAAVQQIGMDVLESNGGFLVRERPRAGVYDAPLLHRMQKLVAVLPAYDLLHVDFGEIAHAPKGYAAGAWRELFGGDPSIANYLFYPQPTTMVATSFVETA
jgi:hypothetical protein